MGYYCSICLESIRCNSSDGSGCQPALVTTACGHNFHLECAMGYAAHKGATQATALSSEMRSISSASDGAPGATPRLTVDCPLCRSQLAEIPWNSFQPHHHAIMIPAGGTLSIDGSDVFIYEETDPLDRQRSLPEPPREQHSCYQHLEPGLKISAAIWFGTLLYMLIWGAGN